MQQIRRTMAAALQVPSLPPEAPALIKAGTPKPQTPVDILSLTVSENSPQRPSAEVHSPQPSAPSRSASRQPKTTEEPRKAPPVVPMVSVNIRLPATLAQELLRVSTDRKIARVLPFTQQEIVAEAVSNWLRKNVGPSQAGEGGHRD